MLRHKDFAAYTHEEFAEARRADGRPAPGRRAAALTPAAGLVPAGRGRPDLRRTVRRALRPAASRCGGRSSTPAQRPRRVVLLCDVSGSMEPYARALVRFLHAAVVGRGRVEAFALGTRLTRLTRELSSRDPDAALARRPRRVPDWSGGTRLGEGLRAFNDRWGVRGMARGAVVVVILSDGWDRGDPSVLAEQMARLRAGGLPGGVGQPVEGVAGLRAAGRGMAAALPYVDEFVEGHSRSRRLETLVQARWAGRVTDCPGGRSAMRRGARRHRALAGRRQAGRDRAGGGHRGLGPRDPGATMAVNEDGEVAGSVSGGCVEGAVVTEALAVLAGGGRPSWSPTASPTRTPSPSASRAAARSTSSSSRSHGR